MGKANHKRINPFYLLCDDLERARQNRQMVAEKRCISGYLEVELALMGIPADIPLPLRLRGELPRLVDQEKVLEKPCLD